MNAMLMIAIVYNSLYKNRKMSDHNKSESKITMTLLEILSD